MMVSHPDLSDLFEKTVLLTDKPRETATGIMESFYSWLRIEVANSLSCRSSRRLLPG
jgi:hypothetical protein